MLDAILSIPMLSFLLIPAMSSYSTSLNLLFFYMTWATLVLSHPPLKVEIVGTTAVRLAFYLLPSFLFFLFDIFMPSGAAVLKAQGHAGLPAGKRGKTGRREAKIAAWSVLNLTLGIAVQGLIEFVLTRVLRWRSSLKVSTRLPMPWAIMMDMSSGLLGREVLQYILHRYALHSPNSRLAKYHDTWYHSLRIPFPLTAHYDHPLAYLVARFIPTFLPAAIFRFHLLSYMLYLTVVSLEETFAYSGYKPMPTSFFIGGIARRVDLHILSKGCGNFGAWGITDWIMGTSISEEGDEDEGSEGDENAEDKVHNVAEKMVGESKKKLIGDQKGKRRKGKNA